MRSLRLAVIVSVLLPASTLPAQATLLRIDAGLLLTSFGESLAPAGDLDADGFDDLVVGASGLQQGRVVSGFDGSTLLTVPLAAAPFISGTRVASLRDVDGDGVRDIVIMRAATLWLSTAPLSLGSIVSGSSGSLIGNLGPLTPTLWGLSRVTDVENLGDVSGDGIDDVVFAVQHDDNTVQTEWLQVCSGADGSVLAWTNLGGGGWSIQSVEVLGQVNPGLSRDVFIQRSAPYPSRVVDGATTGTLLVIPAPGAAAIDDMNGDGVRDLLGSGSILDGRTGAVLNAYPVNDAGTPTGVGDQDGDGVPDIAFTQPSFPNNGESRGQVRFYSGSSGAPIGTATGETSYERFGETIIAGIDIDHDGHGDVVVGAPRAGGLVPVPGGYVKVLSFYPVPVASIVSFPATGCPGGGGTTISASPLQIGAPFAVVLDGHLPLRQALVAVGSPATSIVSLQGCCCYLRVDPATMTVLPVLTDGAGYWMHSGSIPTVPSLAGRIVAIQAAVYDPVGWQFSNGMHLTIGY